MTSDLYHTDDPEYRCWICSKLLRFSSKLSAVVEVESESEHNCDGVIHKQKKQEVGLNCMQMEIQSQKEFYEGQFHSCAQLSNTPTSTYRKQQSPPPKSDQHKQNISIGIRSRFHDRTAIREMQIIALLEKGIKNKTQIAKEVGTSWITVKNTVKQLEGKSKN